MFYNSKKSKGGIDIENYKIFVKVYIYDIDYSILKISDNDEEYSYGNNIRINSSDCILKYDIKNVNNKSEVIKKVIKRLSNSFISSDDKIKKIDNVNANMEIEIWKSGIRETFGNDRYYLNLPKEIKILKIATMECLDRIIMQGKIRAIDAKDYHNDNSKIFYSYLESNIIIDDNLYKVNIDIRRLPTGNNKFYIHSIKKEANLSQTQCG